MLIVSCGHLTTLTFHSDFSIIQLSTESKDLPTTLDFNIHSNKPFSCSGSRDECKATSNILKSFLKYPWNSINFLEIPLRLPWNIIQIRIGYYHWIPLTLFDALWHSKWAIDHLNFSEIPIKMPPRISWNTLEISSRHLWNFH